MSKYAKSMLQSAETIEKMADEILRLQEVNQFLQPDEESRKVMVLAIQGQKKEIESLTTEGEIMREALNTCKQALMEVAHAQECGPSWYTKGASGLRNQVDMWVRRGIDAIRKADSASGKQG